MQDETAAKALTALIAPEQAATSSGPVVADGQVQMLVEYRNDLNGGLEAGFTLAEFGIFAKIGDEQPALLFYAALGEGAQPVQPIADGLDVHRFPVAWTVTDGVSVTLSYPPGAFVSASEKGVPNGVATLGADGKVPEAQLPDMGDGIMLSGGGGVSVMPANAHWNPMGYGAGKFVSCGIDEEGTMRFAYSTNGANWTEISPSPISGRTLNIAYNGTRFAALEYTPSGSSNIAWHSTDGFEWTQTTLPVSGIWYDLIYANGLFVGLDKGTQFVYSSDGVNWEVSATPHDAGDYRSLAFGNGIFVAMSIGGASKYPYYSADGVTWTKASTETPNVSCVAYGQGKFIALTNGSNQVAWYSTDGNTWTSFTKPGALNDTWTSIVFEKDIFVAVGNGGISAYSTDGLEWTMISIKNAPNSWGDIGYGNGKFVVASSWFDDNMVAYSTDGINWTSYLVDGDGTDVTAQVRAALDIDAVDVSVPDDTAAALDIPAGSTVNDALLAAGTLKSRAVTATLTAAGWAGSGPWTQTVTVSGLTSTSNGVVGPTTGVTDAQFEAMQKACLRPSAQSANSLTIKATGTKPTINLPIQVIIVG